MFLISIINVEVAFEKDYDGLDGSEGPPKPVTFQMTTTKQSFVLCLGRSTRIRSCLPSLIAPAGRDGKFLVSMSRMG
jgi:hypothetical protein